MLAEVTEITDKVKLMQLFNLMYSDNPEEFETKLKILPVDLVRIVFRMCSSVLWRQVSSTNVPGVTPDTFVRQGTLLQSAVDSGRKDFAKILLEFG